jgi:predicted site-specific integrase-resolvase
VTIYRWLRDGFITGTQLVAGGPWHIRIDDAMRSKVVGEIPDGWVGLDRAAEVLGVAKQTVPDRIRRGELRAVHVNRGRRRAWQSRSLLLGAHCLRPRVEPCHSVQIVWAPPAGLVSIN